MATTFNNRGTRPGNRGGGRGGNSRGGNNRRGGPPPAPSRPVVDPRPTSIELPVAITVKDLAELMRLTPVDIIKDLMKNGVMATINQELDFDTASIVAGDFHMEVTEAKPLIEELAEVEEAEVEDESLLQSRPPVVTIMGHVDHGKTLLLDAIRSTNVAAREAGGITQHIGAYQVEKNGQKITFLDTPGHAAFTAMRARGAEVTDVAVIVVAADDGVMPQTREAISHARAANVPMIVALNKMDKLDSNPDRVKAELSHEGLGLLEYGNGDIEVVPVSAKTGDGIEDLLTTILLTTEIMNLRANPDRPAVAAVIEANMDRARGPLATVIVQAGTLRPGDVVVAGSAFGRVRALFDDRGKSVKAAKPGTPVRLLGLNAVPEAGDKVQVISDEKLARAVSLERGRQKRAESLQGNKSSADILSRIAAGEQKQLNIILKADTQGSIEAIVHALSEQQTVETKIQVLHSATGAVTESDVLLASASGALIIGFTVRPDEGARRAAEERGVEIRYYDIIYKLTEDIDSAVQGMAEPVYEEIVYGHLEVRATFKAGRVMIAGCYVTDGTITRNNEARVLRGGHLITVGRITSLKRFKEDARDVSAGYECGIVMDGYNEFLEGDVVEAFGQRRVS